MPEAYTKLLRISASATTSVIGSRARSPSRCFASRATSGKADILASNAALSTDLSTWGGSTTKFKTSVTFTPQQKGYSYVMPKMAKVSTTLYYDTKLNVA